MGSHGDASVNDHSGVLKVTDEGVLALLNHTNNIVWSSNSSRRAENPVAQLLDNSNLVVKVGNVDDPNKFLWRSFDYPCNTFLPEMKIGRNFVTGHDRYGIYHLERARKILLKVSVHYV